ncbi:phage tail sheath protein [Roseibium sp. TrichSKD4]|uniref:phage tail sheath C-terminal domain-containing protein n=1 Tax=Roseibium sp. TrichSKD4 TaxID=744980 RepID=UPI0001E56F46|nr:phage tail sheath C-terminal domain-containing protein [Roseibium sp. TrichSKD4]EFO31329.1 phage tail sheath protein [Roseibium sp. TrichSKD4]
MTTDFYHGVEIVEIDTGSRPVRTVKSGVIGLIGVAPDADESAFPLNKPVLMIGRRASAALLGDRGTLPSALDTIFDQDATTVVVVRVAEGDDEAGTLANIIGGLDPDTGGYTGVHAFRASESLHGVRPKILIAPGFSHKVEVVNEMISIADRLRAIIFADTNAANPAEAVAFRRNFNSKRVELIYQKVMVSQNGILTAEPMSSAAAGLRATLDRERGWWWSHSNQTMNVSGFERPVDYAGSGYDSTANYLNSQDISCGIRNMGFRYWGNRGCADDPKWQFTAVVRAHDMIFESIEYAHRWAIDRPITKTLLEDVAEGCNKYFRYLKAQEAILGGHAFPSADLNEANQIEQGKTYLDCEWTPVYPNENMTFRTVITDEYIKELV